MALVAAETQETLSGLSGGDVKLLEDAMGLCETDLASMGLRGREFALARIAALIALGAPHASYAWEVANALDEGATAEDLVAVLRVVAPQVGGARVVAAAPGIMVALGLSVPAGRP